MKQSNSIAFYTRLLNRQKFYNQKVLEFSTIVQNVQRQYEENVAELHKINQHIRRLDGLRKMCNIPYWKYKYMLNSGHTIHERLPL